MSESYTVTINLDQQEKDTLLQIRDKINKEGNNWTPEKILEELAVIGIGNWRKLQLISRITPGGQS